MNEYKAHKHTMLNKKKMKQKEFKKKKIKEHNSSAQRIAIQVQKDVIHCSLVTKNEGG